MNALQVLQTTAINQTAFISEYQKKTPLVLVAEEKLMIISFGMRNFKNQNSFSHLGISYCIIEAIARKF